MKKITAKVGEYTDKEGKTKGRYVDIGVILSNDNGEYALIDPAINLSGVLQKQMSMPNYKGKGDYVMAAIFQDESSKKESAKKGIQEARQAIDDGFDSDIPFN